MFKPIFHSNLWLFLQISDMLDQSLEAIEIFLNNWLHHNIIFTLRIFQGIWHANWGNPINARTDWKYPNMWKSINSRLHFEDMRILMSLTKFDRSHGWAPLRVDWPFYCHLEEYMNIFNLIVHRPKTDLKRKIYGRNRGKRPNT